MDRNGIDDFGDRIIFNSTAELFVCDVLLETVDQMGSRFTVHYVPHFRFTGFPFMLQSIRIIRMDLYRQLIPGINEFEQQRKIGKCSTLGAQGIRLKKLSQDCVLTKDQIYEIMSEEKPNQQEHLRFRREDFNGYFPKSYTEQQIKKDILKGLELLHRHRQRNRDAR